MIKNTFRYTNLEFWVDDELVSKTSKSFQLSHNMITISDVFIKNLLEGWNTRDKLQICNGCESTQTGSRFKFIWTGGEYGKTWRAGGELREFWGNDPYPAAVGRIEFAYRDPGENISFFTTMLPARRCTVTRLESDFLRILIFINYHMFDISLRKSLTLPERV